MNLLRLFQRTDITKVWQPHSPERRLEFFTVGQFQRSAAPGCWLPALLQIHTVRMAGESNHGRAKKRNWRLIRGGKKKESSSREENEILDEMKKYLAQAQKLIKAPELVEYTFVITALSITTRETVLAFTQEEAEKIICRKYPNAVVELVQSK
jgi:hypothetical protein